MAGTLWLVEENTMDIGTGDETTAFHAVVTAPDPATAFNLANGISKRSRTVAGEPAGFMFAAEELEEVVPGYLWEAADGSCIAYQVRSLGTPQPAAPVQEISGPAAVDLARQWVKVRKQVRALLIDAARQANPMSLAAAGNPRPRTQENTLRKLWEYPADLSEQRLLDLIDTPTVI